jgi:uncharacterized protein (DUF2461 family)
MKQLPQIPQSGFDFLNALKVNNNREWFNEHKTEFEKEQHHLQVFAEALLQQMNIHDVIEPFQARKAFTVFTGTPAFRQIKHLIKHTGRVVSNALPNFAGVGTIFI